MKLLAPQGPLIGEVQLPISKSIANRNLIIAALAKKTILLPHQLPEDVRVLGDLLNSNSSEINVGMAGTAMRFLTAFCAVQEDKEIILTGDTRMKQRPIGLLVNGLRELGADISYVEEEGFPPLKIKGIDLIGGDVHVSGGVSSQFISALMLIAPTMKNGLCIQLADEILSKPYIELTADCMRKSGIDVQFDGDIITIANGNYQIQETTIESDWSSASYFYALAGTKPNSKLLLKGLQLNSPQGDSILAEWFESLGVSSYQKEEGIEISSSGEMVFPVELDFKSNPDLAQTFAFLAASLGKELKLTGLDNLRIKETDRISALQIELKKLGLQVESTSNSLKISGVITAKTADIKTYNDHRMVMSAAVLSSKMETEIESPEVVAKSFPAFWNVISNLDFNQPS
ncbi:MAG: 3-phosphoshikimate 1-carboxyvinyltransferase [Polaribacter sp.]|jgi:3-phosphoshikimate 1-carboxyvinyltransferase